MDIALERLRENIILKYKKWVAVRPTSSVGLLDFCFFDENQNKINL